MEIIYNLSKNRKFQIWLNFISNKTMIKIFFYYVDLKNLKNFFRIDILEKLFIKILDNTKEKKFKINAEMMNLLGCTKENFYKLMTIYEL